MADYYQEMGWEPLADGQIPSHSMVDLDRFLRYFHIFNEALSNDNLPPPASKTAVNNLPTITVTEAAGTCPVCLKQYAQGDSLRKLPCTHTFHAECILPWLLKTNSCPLCRHELPTDDENYEALRKEKIRAREREADIETLHNSMFS